MDRWIGPEVLTFAIPLGMLALIILLAFLQHNPHRQ
jgi:hypothetical protein